MLFFKVEENQKTLRKLYVHMWNSTQTETGAWGKKNKQKKPNKLLKNYSDEKRKRKYNMWAIIFFLNNKVFFFINILMYSQKRKKVYWNAWKCMYYRNKYLIILMLVPITFSAAAHLLIILILKYLLYVGIIILSSLSWGNVSLLSYYTCT